MDPQSEQRLSIASSSSSHSSGTSLRRRSAFRNGLVRAIPNGPRPRPEAKRQSTQIYPSSGSSSHRLSVSSTISTSSSSSSCNSAASMPMPTTPPLRPRDLPRLQTVNMDHAKPIPPPIVPQASVHVLVQHNSSSMFAIPMPSAPYTTPASLEGQSEEYEAERVRLTRARMAEDLLARRKASRKGTRSTMDSAASVQSSEWLGDRHFRYAEWQQRQVEAAALERKCSMERESDRAFREWQWDQRRDKAICSIQRGATRVKGRW